MPLRTCGRPLQVPRPAPHRLVGGGAGPGRRAPGLLAVLVSLLAVAFAGQVAAAAPAAAHDYLVSTSPTSGGSGASSPRQVTLTFNEAVNTRFSAVQVTGPSGGLWQDGAPQVLGATVTQALRPLGPAGGYTVTWRVVSADGHPVDGTFSFTLQAAGNGTPASSAQGGGPTTDAPSSSGWVPLAGGLVAVTLLLAAAAAALARRRTRASVQHG